MAGAAALDDDLPEGDTSQDERARTEKKIDDIYDTIHGMFGHLTLGSNEAENALKGILRKLDQVNKLERKLYDALPEDQRPAEPPAPMTMLRIYEMAVKGGGVSTEELTELREANAGLAAEREALLEGINRLLFEVKRLKSAAADELVKKSVIDIVSVDKIAEIVDSIAASVKALEGAVEQANAAEEALGGPALSERMLEAISGNQNPVRTLLTTSADMRSKLADFLRQRGFAYDHQDLYALQHLIAAQQTILEQQDRLIRNVEGLQGILELVNSLQGYRDRQTNEYAEALAQIDRLTTKLEQMEEGGKTLDALNAELEAKKAEKDRIEKEIAALQASQAAAPASATSPAPTAASTPSAPAAATTPPAPASPASPAATTPPAPASPASPAVPAKTDVVADKKEDPAVAALRAQLADKDKRILELEAKIDKSKDAAHLKELEASVARYKSMLEATEARLAPLAQENRALKDRVPLLLREHGRLIHTLAPLVDHEATVDEILEVVRIVGTEDDRRMIPTIREILQKLRLDRSASAEKDAEIADLRAKLKGHEDDKAAGGSTLAAQAQSFKSMLESTQATLRQRTDELDAANGDLRRVRRELEAAKATPTRTNLKPYFIVLALGIGGGMIAGQMMATGKPPAIIRAVLGMK